MKSGLVKNGAEHLVDSININRDSELLQVVQEADALCHRELLPPLSDHKCVDDFQSPDGWHEDRCSVDDGMKHGVGVWSALVLKAPCCADRVVENEGTQNRRPSSIRSRMVRSGPRILPLRSSRMLRPASSRARRFSASSAG